MTAIKIDKNVPIPSPEYPFEKMEVGDSFFVPVHGNFNIRMQIKKDSTASGREYNVQMTDEKVNEKVTRGFRVWRTK